MNSFTNIARQGRAKALAHLGTSRSEQSRGSDVVLIFSSSRNPR